MRERSQRGEDRQVVVVADGRLLADTRRELERAGFSPLPAPTSDAAWLVLGDRPVAAAVLDGREAGSEGWVFAGRVRADDARSGLPLVVLTSAGSPDADERAHSLSAQSLPLPVTAPALATRIEQAARRAPTRDEWSGSHQLGGRPAGPGRRTPVVVVVADHFLEGVITSGSAWSSGRWPQPEGSVRIENVTVWSGDGSRVLATAPRVDVRRSEVHAVLWDVDQRGFFSSRSRGAREGD